MKEWRDGVSKKRESGRRGGSMVAEAMEGVERV